MALSGQIEYYKIHLRGGAPNYTFRDFSRDNYIVPENGDIGELSDELLFSCLFQKILTKFDTTVNSDYSQKKGVSIFHAEGVEANTVLSLATDRNVIEGFLDGGYFGLKRKMSNLDKSELTDISTNKIITDRYYVYLYLPFTSNIGILMIEKRGNQTISKIVTQVLEDVIKNNVGISSHCERFIPREIVQTYKDGAVVDHLSYSQTLSSQVVGDDLIEHEESFDVTVQIRPKGEEYSFERLNALVQKISNMSFSLFGVSYNLSQFGNKKGKLRSDNNRSTPSFDIEEQKIRVVTPIPQDYYDENNALDRDAIKSFCRSLLRQVSRDVYPIVENDGN